MTAPDQPLRLELEVSFDAQPIHGHIYDHGQGARTARPFSGWLGLMAAIDAAGSVGKDPMEARQRGEAGG